MKKNLKGNMKRWIAFLLAVVLVVTTCVYSSDAYLYAADDDTEQVNNDTELVVEDEQPEDESKAGDSDEETSDDSTPEETVVIEPDELSPEPELDSEPEATEEPVADPIEETDAETTPEPVEETSPKPSEEPADENEYKVSFHYDSEKGTVDVKEPEGFTGKEVTVEKEATVKFTVEPNEDYQVNEVKVEGDSEPVEADGDGVYALDIHSETEVKVTFKEDVVKEEIKDEDSKSSSYKVTFDASENGTVIVNTSEGDEVVSGTYSETVEEGSDLSFTVEPDEGYMGSVTVDGKKVDAVSTSENVSTYEVKEISADTSVKVSFTAEEEEAEEDEIDEEASEYKVTINVAGESGTVTVGGETVDASYSETVEKGSSVAFDVEPDEGYIGSVTVNGKSIDAISLEGNVSTYKLNEINADTTVNIEFVSEDEETKDEYEVTLNVADGNGTVTIDGETVDAAEGYSAIVEEGKEFSFVIEPKRGYVGIAKVNGNIASAASKTLNVSTYAVAINADTEIEVAFVQEADKTAMPKQELTAYVGGITVTVKAEAGVLPEGTELVANEVASSKVEDAISDAMNDDKEIVDTIAIDVTLQDKDGEPVQPVEGRNVAVTFSSLSMSGEADSMAVYYVDDAGLLAEKVTGDRAVSDSVVFTTGHFTIYSVASVSDGIASLADTASEVTIGVNEQINLNYSWHCTFPI